MKYIVRVNPKAVNPVTGKVIPDRVWEVEQTDTRASEKVRWHCATVRVDDVPIHEIYEHPKVGEKPWERTYFGTATRDYDDAIAILTGASDVSGN